MKMIKHIEFNYDLSHIETEEDLHNYLTKNNLKVSEVDAILTITNDKNVCTGFVIKEKTDKSK
jgi:hypothetical protein